MMSNTQILDGKKLSLQLREEYKLAVEKLKEKDITPKLVVITVGEDPASKIYVGQKEKTAQYIGFDFEWLTLEQSITQAELHETIEGLNDDPTVTGMIVQFPLPKHLSQVAVTEVIRPDKDVDGFHPYNMGKIVEGTGELYPCTPRGILRLLDRYNIDIKGKDVTVVGYSQIVGKPLSILLANMGSTVTITHLLTRDLHQHLIEADVVMVAAGSPHLVKEDDLKDGAIVIDVGINRLDDGRLVGDVDYEGVFDKVSAITPVPGGVGPMTVAMLMEQTILCACIQHGLNSEDYIDGVSL